MSGEMVYDAYVEAPPDGTVLAQILDLPGCYGEGPSEEQAVRALLAAIPSYHAWLARHDDDTPVVQGPFQVVVKERQAAGALFVPDTALVTLDDLEWELALLDWAFADLAAVVAAIPPPVPAQIALGGRPAHEALGHALDRSLAILACLDGQELAAGAAPAPDVASLVQRAQDAWEATITRLRAMTDEQRTRIFDCDGERWTVRKLLRRGILLVRAETDRIERAK
jgi:predicted RNase H-like HicB family nuclease